MPRQSLAQYVEEFRQYPRDLAFVDRKGYRTVRWTYPRIAETAAQVARELERLGCSEGRPRRSSGVKIAGNGPPPSMDACCVARWLFHSTKSPLPNSHGGSPGRFEARVCVRIARTAGITSSLPRESVQHRFRRFSLNDRNRIPLQFLHLLRRSTRSDVLEILFTSGATADPKGVVITHGNVLSNLAPLEKGMTQSI